MSKVNALNIELLDRLMADAAPVRQVGGKPFMLRLLAGTLAALAIVVFGAGLREDLARAAFTPIFSWKLVSMLAIAVAGLVLLHRSGRPGASTRWLAMLPAATAAVMLLGPIAYLAMTAPSQLLDIRASFGPTCLAITSLAAVPVWLAIMSWLKIAAPTDLGRASWAAGISSASVAASGFVLHCPHDSVAYVVLWYGLAIVGIASLTRIVLPRFIRW